MKPAVKTLTATLLPTAASTMAFGAVGAESPVKFHLTVKKRDGRVLESPAFPAAVGQPVPLRFKGGLSIDALAKPVEADGRARTRVRITYLKRPTRKSCRRCP